MGRRMKRHWLLAASVVLTTAGLTTPAQLSAEPYFMVPLDQEEKPGRCNSEVYAEAIYWAPNPLEFNYADVGNIDPPNLFQNTAVREDLTGHLLDPGYDWGFRFGYRMNRGRWFVHTDFVWIEMEKVMNTTRGPNNTMSIPNLNGSASQVTAFNIARANSNTQYDNAALYVGFRGCDTCRGYFETFMVAEAFYFRFRARVRGQGLAIITGQPNFPIYGEFTQEFENVGLGLGSGLRLYGNLGCGFSVGGAFEAFGSVSRVNGLFEANSLTPVVIAGTTIYQDQRVPTVATSHNCFALGFKGRIGAEYNSCCFGCVSFNGRIGYEIQLVKIGLVGGPFVGLGVNF